MRNKQEIEIDIKRVRKFIADAREEGLSKAEIADATGLQRGEVSDAIRRLVDSKQVERDGHGRSVRYIAAKK